jgi:hypothetical protein
MLSPSHSSPFYRPHNIGRAVHIIQLCGVGKSLFPSPCYLQPFDPFTRIVLPLKIRSRVPASACLLS